MLTTQQQTNPPVPAHIVISALPFLLAAVVFSTLPQMAYADAGCDEFRGPPASQHGGMPPPPNGMMGGGKPPKNMQRSAAPFAELGLSEVQQKKVDELMQAQLPLLSKVERVARQSMQELQQLAHSEKFDENKAKTLAAAHADAVAEMTYLHAQTQARIWGVLTDAQRKQLVEKMEKHQQARPFP